MTSQNTYTFAHVTESCNDRNLTSQHNIGGTLDSVNKRFTTAIVIVYIDSESSTKMTLATEKKTLTKLRLGDRVIDIDGGNL